jgi:hypothetical protein
MLDQKNLTSLTQEFKLLREENKRNTEMLIEQIKSDTQLIIETIGIQIKLALDPYHENKIINFELAVKKNPDLRLI